jgi:hypothetical protein
VLVISVELSDDEQGYVLTRHHPNGVGRSTRPLRPGQRFVLDVYEHGAISARVIERDYVETFLP